VFNLECSLAESVIYYGFIISLFSANISSWRMTKSSKVSGYSGPKWKLFFGDVLLPKETLNSKGKVWRKWSILFFFLLVLFGTLMGYFNYLGSACFGLNT